VRKTFMMVLLAGSALLAQSNLGGSIQGAVTDEQNKPVAGAIVTITRTFAIPKETIVPYRESITTASDGSFLAQDLPPGTYSYCAQVPGDGYLNGCHWGPPLLDLKLSGGQRVRAVIRIAKGSILKVRVQVPASLASQASGVGKKTPIMMGVWDGRGQFFPLHNTGKDTAGLDYQLTVPFDTPLSFQIISAKLKLADNAGVSLPASPAALTGSASQASLQHNSGDPNPKSCQFTVTGVIP
jgi:hypothetical protein